VLQCAHPATVQIFKSSPEFSELVRGDARTNILGTFIVVPGSTYPHISKTYPRSFVGWCAEITKINGKEVELTEYPPTGPCKMSLPRSLTDTYDLLALCYDVLGL
jgi:hypothetical protein